MAVNPMMESALGAGIRGVNSGLKGLTQAAQDVAELNLRERPADRAAPTQVPSGSDLDSAVQALTSLKTYSLQVEASARVIETADEVIGYLLDVRA